MTERLRQALVGLYSSDVDRVRELQLFVDEEADRLRGRLRARIPHGRRVSILLYQPLEHPNHPMGRLVDIAPTPERGSRTQVFQPVGAGRTGLLFSRTDAGEIFEPECQIIDDEAVRTYADLMPAELRRSQVQMESYRYPDIEFLDVDLPPRGNYIHQLTLAPSAVDLTLLNLPVFGIVYTITADGKRTETVQHLIHISQTVSQIALVERTAHLWGEDLVEIAKREIDSSPARKPRSPRPRPPTMDELVRLCFVFVLSHHWFYPHRPHAWTALAKYRGAHSHCLFERFGWPRPPRSLKLPLDSASLVDTLVCDLVHLAKQLCGPTHSGSSPDRLGLAMSTILAITTGGWATMRTAMREDGALPEFLNGQWGERFITISPKFDSLQGEVHVPVFRAENFKNTCNSRRKGKSSRWLSSFLSSVEPGAKAYSKGRMAYLKPELWLRHIGKGHFVVVQSNDDLERRYKWLICLVLLILEEWAFATAMDEVDP